WRRGSASRARHHAGGRAPRSGQTDGGQLDAARSRTAADRLRQGGLSTMPTARFYYEPPQTLMQKLGQVSWLLIAVLCVLGGVGLVALYSVAGGSWTPWAERHAVRFLLGLSLLLSMSIVPLRAWQTIALPAYGVVLALLALVPVIGTEALGARRWIGTGGWSFQ